jgi:hypothetical protein
VVHDGLLDLDELGLEARSTSMSGEVVGLLVPVSCGSR